MQNSLTRRYVTLENEYMHVYESICEIIMEVAGVDKLEYVTKKTNITHDIGLDSIMIMVVIFKIDKAYSISLFEYLSKEYDINSELTIDNIVKTVKKLKAVDRRYD